MSGFSSGFSGCLGVGCAVVFVAVALPAGCLFLGGLGVYEATRPLRDDPEPEVRAVEPVKTEAESKTKAEDSGPVVHASKDSAAPIEAKMAAKQEPSTADLLAEKKKVWRTWTSADRKFRVHAILVDLTQAKVRIRKIDRTEIDVPLEKLSEADRKWLSDKY